MQSLSHAVDLRAEHESAPIDRTPVLPARLPDVAEGAHVAAGPIGPREARRHVECELQEEVLVAQHERGHRLDPSGSCALPDVLYRYADGCRTSDVVAYAEPTRRG